MFAKPTPHQKSMYSEVASTATKYPPLHIDPKNKVPKYKQIVSSIVNDIERGYYAKDDQLMSITELSISYMLSRDTVEKAYRELKSRGYITSVHGKGYFVKSVNEQKLKVLLVLNKMSSYKKIIYYSFIKKLKGKATVDLAIHNYDIDRFDDIINRQLGRYNYYVVMPHFEGQETPDKFISILQKIPENELLLLDKKIPELNEIPCIYQDFEKDIFNALEDNLSLVEKYEKLILIFPENQNYPMDIIKGFRLFCAYNNIDYDISATGKEAIRTMSKKTAFVVIEDDDLAEVIKHSRTENLRLGEDIGVVAFNETTLKELLNVTVITTDFESMGTEAAQMIIENNNVIVKNPFQLINRGSL